MAESLGVLISSFHARPLIFLQGMASAVFEQMRARGAPLNDIREALEKATPIEVWAALPRPPPMVPWQTKERRALFEKLLQEDRKENFTERIRYYEEVKVRSSQNQLKTHVLFS